MSRVLSLVRRKARDLEQGGGDAAKERPAVASATQQTIANLSVRLASAGLIACLAAGPLAVVIGAVAIAKATSGAPAAQSTPVDQATDRAVAGEFATRVVLAWLTSTREQPQQLTALLPAAQAGELPAVAFGASNPAVASITPADGVWAVTVAVTVSDQRPATARRFYQVPVTVTGGTVAALSLPTPVAGPTVAAGPGVDYPVQLASTGPVAVTVAQFLAAYSAGSGEVTRYVSPGMAINAITPAPYSSVQVTDLRCDSTVDSGEAAPEGQRLRLLATARASVTDTQTTTVVYALTVTGRAGRWEIEAIDPTPARKPATASATARQTPAAAPATGSSSSTHHNP